MPPNSGYRCAAGAQLKVVPREAGTRVGVYFFTFNFSDFCDFSSSELPEYLTVTL